MRKLAGTATMALGLALIALALGPGCASTHDGMRTSSVAEAAFIAASVGICVLGSDGPHYRETDLRDSPEMVPESVLGADHFDAVTHDAIGDSEDSDEVVPESVLGPPDDH